MSTARCTNSRSSRAPRCSTAYATCSTLKAPTPAASTEFCGACTVLFDGMAVRSCLIFAPQASGSAITTIEGVTPGPGELSPIQDAFCETHGLQCGYCTPAMIMVAHALLADNPEPTREQIVEAISGNICRCTGYAQIVEAIALAAERMRGVNRPRSLTK